MKVIGFVASVVFTTVLPVGLVLLIRVASPDAGPLSIGLMSAGAVLLVLPGLLAASFSAQWSVDTSTDAGRSGARFLTWYLVAFAALGAVLMIAGSVLGPIPPYIPAAVIALAVVLGVLGYRVGNRIRAASPAPAPSPPQRFTGFDPLSLIRKWRTVATVGIVTLLLLGALVIWLAGSLGEGAGALVHYALVMACFASAITAFLTSLPIARRMREELGGDLGRARTMQRVVLRGRHEELSASDALVAARYAVLFAQHLPFHIAGLILLYSGMVLQNIVPALSLDGEGRAFNVVVAALLVVAMAVLLPIMLRQLERARRYAAEHPVEETVAG